MIPESVLLIAKIAVAFFGGSVWVVFGLLALRWRKSRRETWIPWSLSFMGLYWLVYYILSITGLIIGSSHQFLVRVPILFTLAGMTFLGIKLLMRRD